VAVEELLRAELLRRRDLDQDRNQLMEEAVPPGQLRGEFTPAAMQQWLRTEQDNAAWLRQLLAERGWPGRSLVGDDGAHAAWLLTQNDPDAAFHRRCLSLVRAAVHVGEADARDWAHLLDRVLLSRGQPQVFGTQLAVENGQYRPEPLHDPARVDERRRQVGLNSLAQYILEMQRDHRPLQVRAAQA